jgi:hypothetical protein
MPNPTYPSPTSSGGPSPHDRLVLDNLIRRELKVGDPSDPAQVAQALLERYRDDPRAQAIGQESRGLPFLQAVPVAPVVQMLTAAGGAEWKQAQDDIESDLRSLTTDAILKDVTPELRGWAQAIRTALSEGYNASRFALDPRNRDKGFAMRRQLNDYARLARLVGAHTPSMLTNFRKFAQSLDEAANLLIVIMGEALANVGFGGGRYVPQVAYADLQTRRDAVIYALRNLVGSTQMAYGPEDWPRGLDAYRQLNNLLDAQGQSDLRSLLVETELARTMDELVQRAGDDTSDGLRAVGSTSLLGLERFRRFVVVARRGVSPESPALAAFLEALQLFASAFDSAGGFRLMKIARPPILFYGLYGSTGLDAADQRLVDIVSRRNLVADAIDCVAGACCTTRKACLVLLDKVLYDIDRAIDLYALGFVDFGTAERRASAYAYLIDQVLLDDCLTFPDPNSTQVPPTRLPQPGMEDLVQRLGEVADRLRPQVQLAQNTAMHDALVAARAQATLVLAIAQAARPTPIPLPDLAKALQAAPPGTATSVSILDITALNAVLTRTLTQQPNIAQSISDDPALDGVVGLVEQELCMQLDLERNWTNLVHSLVANCSQIDGSLVRVQQAVSDAVLVIAGEACASRAPLDLPPTIETSLDTLIERVDRLGGNRPNPALSSQLRA